MNAPTAPHELSRHTRDTVMNTGSIKSLQIGMHWFPERAGGLDRMYYSLVGALPGAGVAVRGVVAGSPRVAEDTRSRASARRRNRCRCA
jgi:hypothetical protein